MGNGINAYNLDRLSPLDSNDQPPNHFSRQSPRQALFCTLINTLRAWVCPCSVLRAIGDKRYIVAGSIWRLLRFADPLFAQQAELLQVHRDEPVRIRIDPSVRLSSVSKSVPLSTHLELRAPNLRALLRRLTSRPVKRPHSLPFASLPTFRPALVYQRSA